MTAEISCPGCGHYAHRKHACKGGMGDYCDCGHDKEEANAAPMRDAVKSLGEGQNAK